jgi:hypothetical protein
MRINFINIRLLAGLLFLTIFAFLIQGYHPYAEDAEIYLPGVLKALNPNLFPVNAEFFAQHASHSVYPTLMAGSAHLSHLSLPWVLSLWQIVSIFLMLAGTWRLATAFFKSQQARWTATALMAVLLTLPVAGTALYILDQYPNPRNLAAFAVIWAVAETLHRKYLRSTLWITFAIAVQPFMASFAVLFCCWLVLVERLNPKILGFAAMLPFGISFDPPPVAYHQIAERQSFHFVLRWKWYEWLGVIGPVVLFWWFARIARREGMRQLELVARALIPFILIATMAAVVLSIPARLEALARLQPLRCLALCFMILIVAGGGLLGQFVLRGKAVRSLVLFVPLSVGMFFAQRQLFPASAHIEWPYSQTRNQWAQAFDWIRENTPVNALFALDPEHMGLDGEDENGFRARAQRSMLADAVKDKGAVSMFPPLSDEWLEQFRDQQNWNQFGKEDFLRLRQKYGVSWIVLKRPGPQGLNCPYENSAVRVCYLG